MKTFVKLPARFDLSLPPAMEARPTSGPTTGLAPSIPALPSHAAILARLAAGPRLLITLANHFGLAYRELLPVVGAMEEEGLVVVRSQSAGTYVYPHPSEVERAEIAREMREEERQQALMDVADEAYLDI